MDNELISSKCNNTLSDLKKFISEIVNVLEEKNNAFNDFELLGISLESATDILSKGSKIFRDDKFIIYSISKTCF